MRHLPITAMIGAAAAVAALGTQAGWANPAAADQPGPKGPAPSAPATTSGAVGPSAAVQGYTVVYANGTVRPHRQGNVVAACPAGTTVIGGGGEITGTGSFINSSRPFSGSTSWQVYGNNTSADTQTVFVKAYCAANVPQYQIVSGAQVDNPSHTQTSATVTCPTGTVPYGGGGTASATSVLVNLNSDLPLSGGWRVDVNNNSAADDQVTPVVVCGARPTGYRQVSHTGGTVVDPHDAGADVVDCNGAGTTLGGGGYSDSPKRNVNIQGIISAEGGDHSWVLGVSNGSATATTITAYAVCATTTG